MRKFLLLLSILEFLRSHCHAEQQDSKEQSIEASIKYKYIFSVVVSPDGENTLIGFMDKTPRFSVVSNKTKEVLFTTPEAEKYIGGTWTPDGKWITFLKKISEGTENDEARILEITEPTRYNPFKICALDNLYFFQWAPNGKKIAILANDPGNSALGKKHKDSNKYKVDDLEVAYKAVYGLNPRRIYLMDIDIENKKFSALQPLTPSTFSVTNDARGQKLITWSPDSEKIAFSYQPVDGIGSSTDVRIGILNVQTREIKDLSQLGAAEDPVFSPDGKTLAFVTAASPHSQKPIRSDELIVTDLTVCLLDLENEEKKYLAKTPNESPKILNWLPDGKNILIEDYENTTTALYFLPIDGKPPIRLPTEKLGNIYRTCLNYSRTYVSFVAEGFRFPPEAYIMSLKNLVPLQISNLNVDIPKITDIKADIIKWKSFDGKDVEGILISPVSLKKGHLYPLIVVAHGGPPSAWRQAYLETPFAESPTFASLARHGFVVLAPNIRGSDGYGSEFREALYKNFGESGFQDIMTGVDSLIEQGVADPEKLAMWGWSYGGYMTAWTITRTDRFRAAIVSAGEINLISYATNAETASLPVSFFGGDFWEDYKAWLDNSPIMHVEKVTTPTLIQHGDKDTIVTIDQSYEFYRALRERKIPTQFIVYKDQGHGINEEAAESASKDIFNWLQKYVEPSLKK